MVGYKEDEKITTNQKLIAGCVSGCITRFLLQPLDVIKIRAQVQKKLNTRSLLYGISKRILREEGAGAFWHGHSLGQLHSIMSMGVQFYTYELSTKYSDRLFNEDNRMVQQFLCGVFSGLCVTSAVMPIEVIRVRQIVIKAQYRGLYAGARAVYRTGGIRAFYEGLGTSLLMMGPANGLTFLVFTYCQPMLMDVLIGPTYRTEESKRDEHTAVNVLISSSVAAAIAGFFSKLILYPLDLMKKRLQIGTHETVATIKTHSQAVDLFKCTKLWECLKTTYKNSGIKGLYTGVVVSVLKSQLTMVISFTTYELLCLLFRISGR